jgi:hypothetical protein
LPSPGPALVMAKTWLSPESTRICSSVRIWWTQCAATEVVGVFVDAILEIFLFAAGSNHPEIVFHDAGASEALDVAVSIFHLHPVALENAAVHHGDLIVGKAGGGAGGGGFSVDGILGLLQLDLRLAVLRLQRDHVLDLGIVQLGEVLRAVVFGEREDLLFACALVVHQSFVFVVEIAQVVALFLAVHVAVNLQVGADEGFDRDRADRGIGVAEGDADKVSSGNGGNVHVFDKLLDGFGTRAPAEGAPFIAAHGLIDDTLAGDDRHLRFQVRVVHGHDFAFGFDAVEDRLDFDQTVAAVERLLGFVAKVRTGDGADEREGDGQAVAPA